MLYVSICAESLTVRARAPFGDFMVSSLAIVAVLAVSSVTNANIIFLLVTILNFIIANLLIHYYYYLYLLEIWSSKHVYHHIFHAKLTFLFHFCKCIGYYLK